MPITLSFLSRTTTTQTINSTNDGKLHCETRTVTQENYYIAWFFHNLKRHGPSVFAGLVSLGLAIAFTVMCQRHWDKMSSCSQQEIAHVLKLSAAFAGIGYALSANTLVMTLLVIPSCISEQCCDVISKQLFMITGLVTCLKNLLFCLASLAQFAIIIALSVLVWSTPAIRTCSIDLFNFLQVLLIIYWSFVAAGLMLLMLTICCACVLGWAFFGTIIGLLLN